MEKIIFVIAIVVISMIHSWLQKRKGEPEDDPSPWPTARPRRAAPPPINQPSSPQAPPKAESWEDELRRLLQGDEPAQPPPPVVVQIPPPAPPPLPARESRRSRPAPVVVPQVETSGEMEVGLPVQMPTLEQSAQAYLRASNLEARVAEHMRNVDARVTSHVVAEVKREKSPAIREALALVRNRQSQRAAVIAGIVLGPPKALES